MIFFSKAVQFWQRFFCFLLNYATSESFFAGGTIKAHPKRGVYSALVSARIAYAKALGYQMVGLFAKESTPVFIVSKHGFRKGGDMIYWKREKSQIYLFVGFLGKYNEIHRQSISPAQ